MGEAFERAPELTCEEAQEKMMTALEERITQCLSSTIGPLDIWACIKHRDNCCQPLCVGLFNILRKDKYLSPEELGVEYERFKKHWFSKD